MSRKTITHIQMFSEKRTKQDIDSRHMYFDLKKNQKQLYALHILTIKGMHCNGKMKH